MILKNIFANYLGRVWSALSGFLFIPLYIQYLGFHNYSVISFTLVLAGFIAVADFGLTATLSREFSRADVSVTEKIRVFETLETSYFVIVAIAILIVFSSAELISYSWLNISELDQRDMVLYMRIIALDIGFQLLLRFYIGGLLGLERQVLANSYLVAYGILRNVIVVLIIMFFNSLFVFLCWQALISVFFVLIARMILNKNLTGNYKIYLSLKIESIIFKRIWRFAGGMFLISLVAGLNTQMDKLAISKLLSLEELGYYTLAVSFGMGILSLVSPISTALLPRFTSLYSKGDWIKANKLFNDVSLIISILLFSVLANIIYYSNYLIWIWTGQIEIAIQASKYVPILAFSFSMLALSTLPYCVAVANGYTKLNNIIGLSSLIITMPGYWILISQYGAIGAAVLFCVIQTLSTVFYLIFINKKFIHTRWLVLVSNVLIPLVVSILIVSITHQFIKLNYLSRVVSFGYIMLSTVTTLILSFMSLIILIKFIPLNTSDQLNKSEQ